MIIRIDKFLQREQAHWTELDKRLCDIEQDPSAFISLEDARSLHYLYERAAAGLTQLGFASGQEEAKRYVEALVARAYTTIHSMDKPRKRYRPLKWFFGAFPSAFQSHGKLFLLTTVIMFAGVIFGGTLVTVDNNTKRVFIPFKHLHGNPAERVAEEEKTSAKVAEHHASFAASLMTNNIRVSILVMALGVTFGIGTVIVLFYNGVILGAVIMDYVIAGQGTFLAAWLLPHGSIEIPAILLAGQAGMLMGLTMIGGRSRLAFRPRLRLILPSLATLIGGVAILLVWAGVIESFFSQYHHPVLPYWLKITFGVVQAILLTILLCRPIKGEV